MRKESWITLRLISQLFFFFLIDFQELENGIWIWGCFVIMHDCENIIFLFFLSLKHKTNNKIIYFVRFIHFSWKSISFRWHSIICITIGEWLLYYEYIVYHWFNETWSIQLQFLFVSKHLKWFVVAYLQFVMFLNFVFSYFLCLFIHIIMCTVYF